MKIEQAYLTGNCWASFRHGEVAEIICVKIITLKGRDPRPCFEIKFPDGRIDFTPISDAVEPKVVEPNVYSITTKVKTDD